jgi:23S rRNA (adenine2503-C2)-methyltransferase
MDFKLLEKTLSDHAQPRFRARQVWAWAARGAGSFAEMTDLPVALRATLAEHVPFSSLALQAETRASDGTVKALFRTADGHPLEAVVMSYPARSAAGVRRSICLSSQSGCPLECTFCATGAMRFARNLSASEIVDQALHFRRSCGLDGPAPSNCVFIGMGEPLLNLDSVLVACERLPSLGISHRRTAISTVGWIPGIEALAEQEMPLRLALSVHAAEEGLRSQLMPVNERHPLYDVIEACRAFYARRRRRVFVEYVMLAGVNDSYPQALELARVLGEPSGHGVFKVNLIPYNPIALVARPPGVNGSTRPSYTCSTPAAIAAFRDALRSRGIPTTVRLTRGREIAAACGQLATETS